MKRILSFLLSMIFVVLLCSCTKTDTELFINSEFSEVTMKTVYGANKNVARAIVDNCFASEDVSGISFILPEKWKDYRSDIQIQRIDGGIGVYALADGYSLTSLDFAPYYADLFAVIYVPKDEAEGMLAGYSEHFEEYRYIGYMEDMVCYLLYNKDIDRDKSPMFTDAECKHWKKFMKIRSVIDEYIMINA